MAKEVDTSRLSWEIKYVNPDTRVAIEPYDIEEYKYEEVEKALKHVKVLSSANEKINGQETWFMLELHKVDENGNIKVLLSNKF